MKIVVNNCHTGFSLSEKAYKELRLEWDGYGFFDGSRNDPKLVEIVEKLGNNANGEFSDLKVVEIPDGVNWHIEEYDGIEWIAEDHRTWR